MKLSEIAAQVGGDGRVLRDGEFESLGKVGHRGKRQMLTFCEEPRYLEDALRSEAVSCLVVSPDMVPTIARQGILASSDPRMQFYRLHHFLARKTDFYGRSTPTVIGTGVRLHPTAFVAPTGVIIGNDCEIGPGAVVHGGTTIGSNSRLQSHVVVGSSGFEYRLASGAYLKIDHTGGVSIGDDVDLHSGTVIDRAVYGGCTTVGTGSKLDCGVHLSHNAWVGAHCLIGARTSIMGNTIVGDRCRFGPHVVTSNGITIGDDAYVSLGSVVTRDVSPGMRVTGNFAVEHGLFRSLWDRVRAGEFAAKQPPA